MVGSQATDHGVIALPCRVRDPDRKGKVESAVGHAQKTPLKGRPMAWATNMVHVTSDASDPDASNNTGTETTDVYIPIQ